MDLLVTSNATDLGLDGWLKIAPWGDHPNSVGLQRVQKEDGDAMVAAFNSLQAKAARLFRGIPIYVGHPDRDPNRYPDKRRYGKITALESRADGLYAKPAFNDLGQQVIDQGHYLYNSPVWALRREGNVVRPIELLSIGLTNEPNIKGEPWAKNEAGEIEARSQESEATAPLVADNKDGFVTIDGHVVFVGADKDTTDDNLADGEKVYRIEKNPEHNAVYADSHSEVMVPGFVSGKGVRHLFSGKTTDKTGWKRIEGAKIKAGQHGEFSRRYQRLKRDESSLGHEIADRWMGSAYQLTENTAPALAGGAPALLPAASNAPVPPNPNPQPETPNLPTPMTAEEKAQHETALAALNTQIAELTTAAAALTAANTAAAASLAAANTKAATERTARIELAANSIVAAGRRTTAQRPALVAELAAANDLDAAILAATNAKPALPTQSAVANLGARKGEGYQAAIIAINEAVRAHAVDNKIDIEASGGWERAWLGAKHKHPALFSATNAPAA